VKTLAMEGAEMRRAGQRLAGYIVVAAVLAFCLAVGPAHALLIRANYSEGFEGQLTAFEAADLPPDPQSYEWYLGQFPGLLIGSAPALNYAFGDDGTWRVLLRVADTNATSYIASIDHDAYNAWPVVASIGDMTAQAGATTAFEGVFEDPGWLDTHTANWVFGDGNSASGALSVTPGGVGTPLRGTATATHVYAAPGTYAASLAVRDDEGATSTKTFTVNVGNAATPVPEPTSIALLACAMGGVGAMLKRRRR